jgi:hypothetical protein
MANSKISALPSATTPLAGTEVLPIVQSGTTKQVSVSNLLVVPPSAAFASLPTASTVTNQIYRATDISSDGSLWQSNGTRWNPVADVVCLFSNGIPFIFVPSGIITVTTGALLLGTALDLTYPGAYCYYPAGAWTGSAAGWYWTTFSSTTVGLVYSDKYTSGVPTVPTSPTLVTTGAGAYTQTTGAYITGINFVLPGNAMGINAGVQFQSVETNNNSAGAKYLIANFGAITGNAPFGSTTVIQSQAILNVKNSGSASTQSVSNIVNGTPAAIGLGTVNTASNITLSYTHRIATATDWVICQNSTILLLA